MANFDAPSFSLGLDFDADLEPQLPAEDHLEPIFAPNPSASFNIIEENADEFESEQVMDSDPDTRPDPPRVLKRLRRAADESSATKKESEKTLVWDNGDDDIEEFSSSQEKNDVDSSTQYHSVCSSSKIPLKRLGLLTTQSSSQSSSRKAGQASVASASASLKEQQSTASDRKRKASFGTPQNEDLWKDISLMNSSCVQTPAFDEVCKEYFQSLNDKNASQKLGSRKADLSSQELGSQKTEQLQDLDDPLPPAHRYFFHADPRIQNLVRSQLPFFSPLSMVDNGGHQQPTVSIMDFKNQFNKGESSKQRGSRKGSGKNCSISRSSKSKKPNAENGAFEGWVNPKTSGAVPKNAGKRRVHASGQPAGHWYTSPEGRKVYITRTGQELSGQMAYRHYRKESGGGVRKSKSQKSKGENSNRDPFTPIPKKIQGAFMNWQLPYHPFLLKFGVQRPPWPALSLNTINFPLFLEAMPWAKKLVRVEDNGRSFYRPKHEDYSRMERKFEISGNERIFH
ncbi:hypothetical protein GOBAR_AA20232 [Gossypium barbadense]|uniref:Uncharacterized protein n=1 Tax=Gossypium barbadense TaxID=3634 RepID=A0A2P5XAU0_GOSBA|nr:hypothetical protein GOBAR_AA20232 [Gossypium barbadense]